MPAIPEESATSCIHATREFPRSSCGNASCFKHGAVCRSRILFVLCTHTRNVIKRGSEFSRTRNACQRNIWERFVQVYLQRWSSELFHRTIPHNYILIERTSTFLKSNFIIPFLIIHEYISMIYFQGDSCFSCESKVWDYIFRNNVFRRKPPYVCALRQNGL